MTQTQTEPSNGGTANEPVRGTGKPPFDWARVSVIATAIVAVSGAAVSLKDHVTAFFGLDTVEGPADNMSAPAPERGDGPSQRPPMAVTTPPGPGGESSASPPPVRPAMVRYNRTETEMSPRGNARNSQVTIECEASPECARIIAIAQQGTQYVQQAESKPSLEQPDGPSNVSYDWDRDSEAPLLRGPVTVYFDWDRDKISPQAAAILDNLASNIPATVPLSIAGHADRSGPDDYNLGLSRRRAANVGAYLAAHGISDTRISTTGFGESRPLIDSGDGVREPQNRRVEFFVGFLPSAHPKP